MAGKYVQLRLISVDLGYLLGTTIKHLQTNPLRNVYFLLIPGTFQVLYQNYESVKRKKSEIRFST